MQTSKPLVDTHDRTCIRADRDRDGFGLSKAAVAAPESPLLLLPTAVAQPRRVLVSPSLDETRAKLQLTRLRRYAVTAGVYESD
ncbi:hypothetical protein FQA47_016123 [Oryzias melastigma]|uniref:Uncharacterized protein n=1 Tax=Oryzias melastigma TaxID=30732 RepID=A0A834L2Z1_ORYME|nr:hypothetical protein FQA47_016123 [Oryzias melastigma]